MYPSNYSGMVRPSMTGQLNIYKKVCEEPCIRHSAEARSYTAPHFMIPTELATPSYQAYGNWYIQFNVPGCYGLQIDWLH